MQEKLQGGEIGLLQQEEQRDEGTTCQHAAGAQHSAQWLWTLRLDITASLINCDVLLFVLFCRRANNNYCLFSDKLGQPIGNRHVDLWGAATLPGGSLT